MILEQLREQAGFAGPSGRLANELLVIRQQYESGELNQEEYSFLLSEVADVKAQQELANDEIACRWIAAAAQALLLLVP
jgi:hypothetical protein